MVKVDLDGRIINPAYHDCMYKGNPDLEYKACNRCIYRFTCKHIRYNLPNPLKKEEKEK
jgi:hypothetical protein